MRKPLLALAEGLAEELGDPDALADELGEALPDELGDELGEALLELEPEGEGHDCCCAWPIELGTFSTSNPRTTTAANPSETRARFRDSCTAYPSLKTCFKSRYRSPHPEGCTRVLES
jgi:hypothetical protein